MGWKTADLKLVKEDASKAVIETDYQSMISSLLYLAIFTRADIYLIFRGAKFNSCPTAETPLTPYECFVIFRAL